MDFSRYQRQLALPDISYIDQRRLSDMRILVVGAGGLGCASLPYVVGAGVGHITIVDDDKVELSNLHRQVLYGGDDIGAPKSIRSESYLNKYNPDVIVKAIDQRFTDSFDVGSYDLLVDGSDNFETKSLLNQKSIEASIPLVSASVQQYSGQVGVFAGYAKDQPCYHCLFPELPTDACNCNDGGVLGSVVGVIGTLQAHVILSLLLGHGDVEPGFVFTADLKSFRFNKLKLSKDTECGICEQGSAEYIGFKKEIEMAELVSLEELNKRDHIVVDVRTDAEVADDPILGANGDVIHMEVSTVPARYEELPKDKLLAFVCAGNVRSVKAAEYLQGIGFDADICVLDKFSIPA